MNSPAVHRIPLHRTSFFYVWLGLVAVTCLSFWIGLGHRASTATLVDVSVIVIATVKIRFIGLYFMELKDAPRSLRGIFEAYCVCVCVALVALVPAL